MEDEAQLLNNEQNVQVPDRLNAVRTRVTQGKLNRNATAGTKNISKLKRKIINQEPVQATSNQ
jgi:hypothetical protein